MSKKRIPVAVCAIVNDVLRGSHNSLDALFERAGAPGPPPDLSHASKWKTWLLKANDDPDTDAYSVLGRVIEELMELEPTTEEEWYNWRDRKQRVEDALRTYGLKYVRGGRIIAEKPSEYALRMRKCSFSSRRSTTDCTISLMLSSSFHFSPLGP